MKENIVIHKKTQLICKRPLGRQSGVSRIYTGKSSKINSTSICVCVFREVGHEGSCCQNTISSSKQQLHFSGCPNTCSHPTTANSHHRRPSLTPPSPLRLCFFWLTPSGPLVLNPLQHLHHFVFLHACFEVTFLPRGSRIWYRFLILLGYSHETEHILHLYFLSLSLCTS